MRRHATSDIPDPAAAVVEPPREENQAPIEVPPRIMNPEEIAERRGHGVRDDSRLLDFMVIEVCDSHERLRAKLQVSEVDLAVANLKIENDLEIIARLRSALSAAQRDSERLDFLNGRVSWIAEHVGYNSGYADAREAIDAARRAVSPSPEPHK